MLRHIVRTFAAKLKTDAGVRELEPLGYVRYRQRGARLAASYAYLSAGDIGRLEFRLRLVEQVREFARTVKEQMPRVGEGDTMAAAF